MQRYYIFEALFVLLGLALVVAVIKYPKDAFIRIPLGIVKGIIKRIKRVIALPLFIISIPILWLANRNKWKPPTWIQNLADDPNGD